MAHIILQTGKSTIKAVNCGGDLKLQEGLDFERLLFFGISKKQNHNLRNLNWEPRYPRCCVDVLFLKVF